MKKFTLLFPFIFLLLIGCGQANELLVEELNPIAEPVVKAYDDVAELTAVPSPTLIAPTATAVPTEIVATSSSVVTTDSTGSPTETPTQPPPTVVYEEVSEPTTEPSPIVVAPTATVQPTEIILTASPVVATDSIVSPTETPTQISTATSWPTNTPIPTATLNWSATATAEWIPTATSWPTNTPMPTATSVPPTAIVEPTATLLPTHTPMPTVEAEPTVDFWLTPDNPQPGDRVHVGWDIGREFDDDESGLIHVGVLNSFMIMNTGLYLIDEFHGLSSKGEIWFDLPEINDFEIHCFEELPINLFLPGKNVASIGVPYEMTPWVFQPDPSATCPLEPQLGRLSEQRFERGWMVWSEEKNMIYVLDDFQDDEGRTMTKFWNDFDINQDIIEDASIVPPDGLLQPRYGFGKVWRENSWVQERLGWAVSAEFNQTNYIQEYPVDPYDTDNEIFISGADGFVWGISIARGRERGPDNRWHKTSIPNPQP